MSDPLDHNENAPDDALLGPGSTATGGGTSQDATGNPASDPDTDDHIRPLNRRSTASPQLADERFRSPDL